MNKGLDAVLITILLLAIVLLFGWSLSIGSADISLGEVFQILSGKPAEYETWSYIIEDRFNRSVVAIFGGGALAVSGLILQVFFRNPLAGPGVLGITSGASLGVAIVLLGGMSLGGFGGSLSIILFGSLGAFAVLFLLLFLSRFIRNQVTLLVIGLMIGYFTSALVNMLFLWASEGETREFVLWGLGSFSDVQTDQMLPFLGIISVFAASSVFMIKGLNAMVLGEQYTKSLGVNLRMQKILMIVITSILAAVVTSYCGPISFIGIAVPQMIRVLAKSKNHTILLPLCFLGGSVLGILSDIIVRASGSSLPLNTVTALIGAPIIIWTIIKMNKRFARM